MKIEQKHNSKIPAYAAGAALVASTVLMTSCQIAGEITSTTAEPQIDGDVAIVSETFMPVTREYLTNVSRNYTLDDLQIELGSYQSYTDGKYYSWNMEDGSIARFMFGEDGKISKIYIDGVEKSLIYIHDDSAEIGAVILDFFTSFATPDYQSMKKFCTMNCSNEFFHENDVYGMISAKLTSYQDITYMIGKLIDGGAKNILNVWGQTSQTISDIVWTINADGTVRAQGTASANSVLYIWRNAFPPPAITESIVVSGCPAGASDSTYDIAYTSTASGTISITTPQTISQAIAATTTRLALRVYSGQTVDIVFKPMVCRYREYQYSTEFVPYSPTNAELYQIIRSYHP